MSTKVIRATGANVSPSEDARLFNQMFQQDGIFNDPLIVPMGGSMIHVPALFGIMQGRDFTTDPMSVNATLPNSGGTGFLIVRFDTTTDNIISIKTELAPYTPTYEDINAGGNICEMIIAEYTASPTAVTAVSNTFVNPNKGGHMIATLAAGDTSVTFTNPMFNNDTWFDIHTDSFDAAPSGWSFAGNTLTVMFRAQAANHEIGIIYKNFN